MAYFVKLDINKVPGRGIFGIEALILKPSSRQDILKSTFLHLKRKISKSKKKTNL